MMTADDDGKAGSAGEEEDVGYEYGAPACTAATSGHKDGEGEIKSRRRGKQNDA